MDNETTFVRKAGFGDARRIFELIKEYPDTVLPKSMSDILQNIDRFLLYEENGLVIGTVSWQILPDMAQDRHPAIEITSLTVAKSSQRKGVGATLARAAIEVARALNPEQIIALTFTPEFFESLGFERIDKKAIMHKIYSGCVNCAKYDSPFTCPEVAMRLKLR